jgi:hypothetical protein
MMISLLNLLTKSFDSPIAGESELDALVWRAIFHPGITLASSRTKPGRTNPARINPGRINCGRINPGRFDSGD